MGAYLCYRLRFGLVNKINTYARTNACVFRKGGLAYQFEFVCACYEFRVVIL